MQPKAHMHISGAWSELHTLKLSKHARFSLRSTNYIDNLDKLANTAEMGVDLDKHHGTSSTPTPQRSDSGRAEIVFGERSKI